MTASLPTVIDTAADQAAAVVLKKLHHHPIKKLLEHRRTYRPYHPLISIHESTTLGDVLRTLSDHAILAVPVYSIPEEEPTGKQFTGIISVYDILAWTVFQKMFDGLHVSKPSASIDLASFQRIQKEQAHYFDTPVKVLVGMTSESVDSWTLHSSDPISSLVQMFATGRYHRCLVIDEDALVASALLDDDGPGPTAPPTGSSITMITQTDVIRYLYDMRSSIDVSAVETIFSLHASQVEELQKRQEDNKKSNGRRVVAVPQNVSALAAFRIMYENMVRAVPIVDPHNRIIANLSASDLRGITPGKLDQLLLPVFEFLETGIHREPNQLKADQLRDVNKSAQLGEVIESMIDTGIHRVWVTGYRDKIAGVVTMTDVLCAFVPVSQALEEE
ncbi:uncharacterized protein BJ171DRAFT_46635 [Polychytrium aggregatum]|uniref:uncharacterized protein n=1 Tax=Polychytrium aggregatum TaxID=110093 RepID=UPI0022FF34E6|nr:uncharacterized protein BJ171DRAFT_46635 [Polychytrium aggregatum]KAI9190802.1 hypothetical protein BJ171DRAFT_46635 [Polychytrium aggregatum]